MKIFFLSCFVSLVFIVGGFFALYPSLPWTLFTLSEHGTPAEHDQEEFWTLSSCRESGRKAVETFQPKPKKPESGWGVGLTLEAKQYACGFACKPVGLDGHSCRIYQE